MKSQEYIIYIAAFVMLCAVIGIIIWYMSSSNQTTPSAPIETTSSTPNETTLSTPNETTSSTPIQTHKQIPNVLIISKPILEDEQIEKLKYLYNVIFKSIPKVLLTHVITDNYNKKLYQKMQDVNKNVKISFKEKYKNIEKEHKTIADLLDVYTFIITYNINVQNAARLKKRVIQVTDKNGEYNGIIVKDFKKYNGACLMEDDQMIKFSKSPNEYHDLLLLPERKNFDILKITDIEKYIQDNSYTLCCFDKKQYNNLDNTFCSFIDKVARAEGYYRNTDKTEITILLNNSIMNLVCTWYNFIRYRFKKNNAIINELKCREYEQMNDKFEIIKTYNGTTARIINVGNLTKEEQEYLVLKSGLMVGCGNNELITLAISSGRIVINEKDFKCVDCQSHDEDKFSISDLKEISFIEEYFKSKDEFFKKYNKLIDDIRNYGHFSEIMPMVVNAINSQSTN